MRGLAGGLWAGLVQAGLRNNNGAMMLAGVSPPSNSRRNLHGNMQVIS
jgi:hypothetical protein